MMTTTEVPKVAHYRYTVTWSPEDGEYVAQVTEFPSLSWLAADKDEALHGLEKLVNEVVQDMISEGEQVPVPLVEREFSGNLRVRVSPAKHRQLVILAQEQGVSLNRYLVERLAG
ncbi:type II toxin-antitoxin system HicB family antitoxin [Paenarthrobacter sp. NPDC058233]|uniref:type II toxin-antitoxin system HicB family antitoxin n=2 Tax=unclassified Paenarthrobacter TaxID=2634190 RepID=UPI0036DE0665